MRCLPGENASFDEPEYEEDRECSPYRRSRRNDLLPDDDGIEELISDAEASGLINDSIDRCFEATMRRAE